MLSAGSKAAAGCSRQAARRSGTTAGAHRPQRRAAPAPPGLTPAAWCPFAPSAPCSRPADRLRASAASGGGGGLDDGSELDVAVFRFTLGIPGFDDSLVPRVVGGVAAAALAVNHILSAQPVAEAQVRAEFLCAPLVALLALTPEIEQRLKSVLPGRGRQQASEAIDGAARVFALSDALSEADKRELAWLTFALLKNVNCCGAALTRGGGGGRAVVARGALGSGVAGADAAATLEAISQDVAKGAAASPEVAAIASGQRPQLWLPDRAAMARAGADGWASVPRGAQSLLLQAVPGGGLLAVVGDRPRALPDKDRRWVAALAAKL